jgi:L-asparaginase II
MDVCRHFPLIETTRGDTVESIHYGSVAITFYGRKDTISIGDSKHPFFLRSSAKPFQALALIERGGGNQFNFSPQEIAIICASHSGTDLHVDVLSRLQKKIGITEDILQCGLHPPLHKKTAQRMLKNNQPLHPNRHNCSGKHTGMLAFAKMIGAPFETYLEHTHPVQKLILNTFAEMCEMPVDSIHLGMDGCSAPVFSVPLANAATAYVKLCQPDNLPLKRANACKTITSAMAAHPNLVAGPDRFDTTVMETAKGKIITKIGAEGYQGIGVMPGACKLFKGSIGITSKISDGDLALRAGSVVSLAVLERLRIFSDQELAELKEYYIRPIKNYQGTDIGEIRPTAEFLQALDDILL